MQRWLNSTKPMRNQLRKKRNMKNTNVSISAEIHQQTSTLQKKTYGNKGLGSGCSKHFLQFTAFEQLSHNIAATQKFTTNIELRNGWPIRKIFYTLAQFWIAQYIDPYKLNIACT